MGHRSEGKRYQPVNRLKDIPLEKSEVSTNRLLDTSLDDLISYSNDVIRDTKQRGKYIDTNKTTDVVMRNVKPLDKRTSDLYSLFNAPQEGKPTQRPVIGRPVNQYRVQTPKNVVGRPQS